MSFFAATSSTSIWPVPVSCSAGVRIWTSMFTSFTSKGMYCSASHWMLSSSSSWLIRGMEIFLMITLWPLTPMATSRLARTLPPGRRPYKKTVYLPVSTEYLPKTTEPPRGLLRSPVPVPGAVAAPPEQLGRVLHREAEGEEDLALGLQAAVLAGLDAVDGGFRDSRLARELRLRHQLLFPEPLDVVHAP